MRISKNGVSQVRNYTGMKPRDFFKTMSLNPKNEENLNIVMKNWILSYELTINSTRRGYVWAPYHEYGQEIQGIFDWYESIDPNMFIKNLAYITEKKIEFYYQISDDEMILEIIDQYISQYPDDVVTFHRVQKECLRQLERTTQILTILETKKLNPLYFDEYAVELMDLGNFGEARDKLLENLDLHDDHAKKTWIFLLLGICYNKLGNSEQSKFYLSDYEVLLEEEEEGEEPYIYIQERLKVDEIFRQWYKRGKILLIQMNYDATPNIREINDH